MRKFASVAFASALGLSAAVFTPNETLAYYYCHGETDVPIFDDVCYDTPHADEIRKMKDLGIVTGYSDNNFYPQDTIVRGQVATMMTRALDIEVPNSVTEDLYNDVSATHYYAPVVKAITDAGIMTGVDHSSFDTSRTLQRQQMATILMRVLNMHDVERLNGDADEVTDLEDAFEVHKENIIALQAHGITQTSDGAFRPTEPVTRGQFSSFLERTLTVIYTEELGFQSIDMVDPNTFNIHFFRDIDGEDWDVEDFRFGPDPTSVEVIEPRTLQLTTESSLRYGNTRELYYQNERTTLSYQREASNFRNVSIDVNGGRIDVSGEIPGATDDTSFYLVLYQGIEEIDSADTYDELRLTDERFEVSFSRVEPGDYWLLIDSLDHGLEEFTITVDPADITLDRVDGISEMIRNKADQHLEFDVDGMEYSIEELEELGFSVAYDLEDGYDVNQATGMIDATEFGHLETFTYTVTIRDESGQEVTSEPQEVTVYDVDMPVNLGALLELDGETFSTHVRPEHEGASLIFSGQNKFDEPISDDVLNSLTISEVTSSNPEHAEYDLEEGLMVHSEGETTFTITFEELDEVATRTIYVSIIE